jgi:sporulation protein YlmC with PRC-barrel domain
LTFKGNKVDILYNYADNPLPIEKAELKDGKIITEYGYSDTYVITPNSLCVPNPETGESDCYAFIRSKSTHDIEETINPELPGSFKGQTLKEGEKVIKINWGKENKTSYRSDWSGYSRYASNSLTVPNGKKWILLYINEVFTFESGQALNSVPDFYIDKREYEINNRRFSDENNINLPRAKDENIKIYSGSTIKAISSRVNGKNRGMLVGVEFIEYKGDMWFLEINE